MEAFWPNLMLTDGGPTAIRTRVRGSASHCDIQATLWGQCIFGDLPSPFKRNGSQIRHSNWAHWFFFAIDLSRPSALTATGLPVIDIKYESAWVLP